jgi:hypothetical protein
LAAKGDPDTGRSWPLADAEKAEISLLFVVELLATYTNATGLTWATAASADIAEIKNAVPSKTNSLMFITKRAILFPTPEWKDKSK